MLTVLVTGSMGAGKSAVMSFLELKLYPVFRADAQAKELLSPQSSCYSELKQLFAGDRLMGPQGSFDKKKLADLIFQSPDKRKAIENIIHPLVQESFRKFVQNQEKKGKSTVFYEVPLISKSIFDSCDKQILIVCPEEIKKRRLIKQGWTESELKKRWAVQIPESEIMDKMDFIIDNKADLKELHTQVDEILSDLENKC